MDFKGLRLQRIILVAVLTFILILSGQFFYRRYFVLEPLLKSLQEMEEVKAVNITTGDGVWHFMVSLMPVNDLAIAYNKLEGKIGQVFADDSYILSIIDQRDEELTELYHQIHFSIFEANALGNFTSMAAAIDEQITDTGLSYYRVAVDDKQIYLQLHKDNYIYLYEIISR